LLLTKEKGIAADVINYKGRLRYYHINDIQMKVFHLKNHEKYF